MTDARFEDGEEGALRLRAEGAEDLPVLSALVQDAVTTRGDLVWQKKRRRFALLLNRFRWEDRVAAQAAGRPFERVRSLLVIEDVRSVQVQGLSGLEKSTVLSLLSLSFEPGEDGTGRLTLTFAGDGAVALAVEALDVSLQDVTRPYLAPSRKAPGHPA